MNIDWEVGLLKIYHDLLPILSRHGCEAPDFIMVIIARPDIFKCCDIDGFGLIFTASCASAALVTGKVFFPSQACLTGSSCLS